MKSEPHIHLRNTQLNSTMECRDHFLDLVYILFELAVDLWVQESTDEQETVIYGDYSSKENNNAFIPKFWGLPHESFLHNQFH